MILLSCLGTTAAQAHLKYYPDPVYQKLNDDDSSPMTDMIDLAAQGDVRAQFIMGDLYSKGKGGVAKDLTAARHWFEESGIHGYGHSFIRLAALAKHDNRPKEAWQWYSLAIKTFDYGDERKYAIQARHDLVENATLSEEDIREARKSMSAWEDMRDQHLYDEKKAVLEQKNKLTSIAGENKNEQDKSQDASR
ncbi:MAG: sel1 repeat family protein [Proteobacteria bacterium]|nr:sel1 repeat family protein [Pseudomonadota bacterium]